MKQIKTAKEMLAQIEKDFFKGIDLSEASLLKGDERRTFVLAQVERLLTEKHGSSPLSMYLSDMFWTADEGRRLPKRPNPLMLLQEQQTLTDREMGRLRLILEIAGLCHDLSLHFTFDLKDAFGIKNNFWVSNKQLVEFLSTTPYERIAMHTAYILKKHATGVYADIYYQPAQDTTAEIFSSEYHTLVREPDRTKIPPRSYVKIIVDELQRIERHWQRGRRLKLKPDLVMLHDEIYGVVPLRFDKGVLAAAQALFDHLDKEVYGRFAENDDLAPELMRRFAEKVREVRSEYLAKGWVDDNSLEFAYLMAHAQNCGYGIWREEDNAL